MKLEELKYRNELKYICTEQQLCIIEQRISNICQRDVHGGENGVYEVRSVYFDDYRDTCYYDNESGINVREKFRIRIYNGNMDHVTLECKRKENGKNHKFSCTLTQAQCRAILADNFMLGGNESSLLSKFFLQYRMRQLRPKVIVQYERTPYVYGPGNVRITLDRNISASARIRDFEDKKISVQPVMHAGYHILEVKYDEFFPDFLRRQIQIEDLQQTAYSKYCMCRQACR